MLCFCTTHDNRYVRGITPADTIIVCQVQGSFKKEEISQLGAALSSIVSEAGLLLVWQHQQCDDSAVNTADLVFELAGAGLIPALGSDAPKNFLEAKGLAAYFQKQDFIIRNPSYDDVDSLVVIDRDSWAAELRYPDDIIKVCTITLQD